MTTAPRRKQPSRSPSPRSITSGPRRDAPVLWVNLAVQYYVGARVAAFWSHRPNADIQAHHALEMALKWALARPIGGPRPWPGRQRARARKELWGHDLMKLWTLLNEDYPGHQLGRFSRYVQLLDRVETLDQRYASFPHQGAIAWAATVEEVDPSSAETYAIDLPRLDELFHGLLHLTATDSLVVRAIVVPRWPNEVEAQEYYRRDNAAAFTW